MAKQNNKYRITDVSHPRYGEKFRGIPTTELSVIDVKTKEYFDMSQIEKIGDAHAVYGGMYIGRLGVFLFAREYTQYHTLQFGVAVDHIKHDDAYLDIELKIAVVGVGIRITWLAESKLKRFQRK